MYHPHQQQKLTSRLRYVVCLLRSPFPVIFNNLNEPASRCAVKALVITKDRLALVKDFKVYIIEAASGRKLRSMGKISFAEIDVIKRYEAHNITRLTLLI